MNFGMIILNQSMEIEQNCDNCRSFGLRPKTWAYLMDDGSEHKNAKGIKKCNKM